MAVEEGSTKTHLDGLTAFRASAPRPPFAVEYQPCLCMVGQGRKQVTIGDQIFEYNPQQCLVVALPLPVTAQILEASRQRPFFAAILKIDVALVGQLLVEMSDDQEPSTWTAMRTSKMEPQAAEAARRLLRAANDPVEARVLGPGIVREVLFHLLAGAQGDALRLLARRDGLARRVARAIRFMEAHYDQPLDVASIAKSAGISGSRLQHIFKDVTALSPIQYLKKVRLHRARMMMLAEGLGASEAAHRVGYGSPSQFSREFKRQFGLSPSRVTHVQSSLQSEPEGNRPPGVVSSSSVRSG